MTPEKKAALLAKHATIKAQLRLINGKEKRDAKKKADRMKILAGAYLLEQTKGDSQLAAWLHKGLDGFLTRPEERALFGLGEKSASVSGNAGSEVPETIRRQTAWR